MIKNEKIIQKPLYQIGNKFIRNNILQLFQFLLITLSPIVVNANSISTRFIASQKPDQYTLDNKNMLVKIYRDFEHVIDYDKIELLTGYETAISYNNDPDWVWLPAFGV